MSRYQILLTLAWTVTLAGMAGMLLQWVAWGLGQVMEGFLRR
jgi:hypothetical protein